MSFNMEEKELTVEQVRAAANEQITILYQKLQEANMSNVFKRLDYLYKIAEGKFPQEMIDKAIIEIDKIVIGNPKEDNKE